jgi:Flp pilus assembly protein TadG
MRLLRRLIRLPRRLWRHRRGNYSMIVVLLLPVLTGFVGLGTEAGLWFYTHQSMQGAADAAAFSGAQVAISGGQWSTEALAVAASHGFTNGAGTTSVQPISPPQAGSHIGVTGYYEVFISQQQNRLFSALLISTPVTITARAVATVASAASGNGCLVALDPTVSSAIAASGTAQLNLAGCNLYDDSSSSLAFVMSGTTSITANAGFVVGSASVGTKFHGTLNAPGAAKLADPFKTLAEPSPSGCAASHLTLSSLTQQTLNPGTYCSGVSLSGQAELDLNPGIYVLDQGQFTMSGGTSLWCPPKSYWNTAANPPVIQSTPPSPGGCTIVLTSSLLPENATGCATLSLSGGAKINLQAPSSGTTQGFSIMSNQACCVATSPSCSGGSHSSLSGGTTQNIVGTIYLPTYSLTYSGGSSTDNSQSCLQLITDTISFSGNAGLGNNCSSFPGGFRKFGNTAVLAE